MSGPGDVKGLAQRIFHACLFLLGAAIAINVAVAYLEPVIPWLISAAVVVFLGWLVVAIVRWRRSRW